MYVQTKPNTIVDAFGSEFKRNTRAEAEFVELFGDVQIFIASRASVKIEDGSVHSTDAIIIKRESVFIYVSGIRTEELIFRRIKVTKKRVR